MYGTLTVKQDFIPLGNKNRPADQMVAEYITIHDTANKYKGANALNHAKYLKNSAVSVPASWHFTVDEHLAAQHLPINETAYHAGDGRKGTGNAKSIGIEICENIDGDRTKAEANAVILVAHLLKELGLAPDKVVQHNKWSGKNCPATFRSTGSWDVFIAKIKHEYDTIMAAGATTNKSGFKDVADTHWAAASIIKATNKGLMKGVGEGMFHPDNSVTRAQLAVILDRAGVL